MSRTGETEVTAPEIQHVVVHGYRRAYRRAGSGPALLLIHGLACDSTTWLPVMDRLAEQYTVIAPDLLGHGESDKPDADYSLGGYANGMRDLLTVLGIDRVTVVGHSLGGGIAMQFAYQHPERVERIVLVAAGGLGRQVSPLIRMLTVPGSGWLLGAATARPWRPVVSAGLRAASHLGAATRDLDEVARIYESLAEPRMRTAVRRVTGHVVNWRGQMITMNDRAYLARMVPVMVVWGRDDHVLPSRHADRAPAAALDVHVLEDSGHFPHKDHPEEFVRLVDEFITTHPAGTFHRGMWRALLRRGDRSGLTPVPPVDADSAAT